MASHLFLSIALSFTVRLSMSMQAGLGSQPGILHHHGSVHERSTGVVLSREARHAALISLLNRTALRPKRAEQGTFFGGIPKRIHTTWRSKNALERIEELSIRKWRHLNPDCEYHFWNDTTAAEFLRLYAPRDAAMLRGMKKIQRFDYFRYALLDAFGGVYHDVDVLPRRPIWRWLPAPRNRSRSSARLVTGWEARLRDTEEKIFAGFARQDQLQQWTIASVPEHPVLKGVIAHIRNASRSERNSTIEFTGPGAWSDAVLAYVGKLPLRAGSGAGKDNRFIVKDVAILEKDAFAFWGYPNITVPDGSPRLVDHLFKGSWKSR